MKSFLLSLAAAAMIAGLAVLAVFKTDTYVEIQNRQAYIDTIADDPAVAKR